jgi:hypothetical protein
LAGVSFCDAATSCNSAQTVSGVAFMFKVAMIISSDIENTTMNGLLRQAQRKRPPPKKGWQSCGLPPKRILMNKKNLSILQISN